MDFRSIDPATGETIASFPETSPEDLARALERAGEGFQAWRSAGVERRVALLRAVAAGLREGLEEHARLLTGEMGKPLAQARGEVTKCAGLLDHVAGEAAGFLEPIPVPTDARRSYVAFEPIGVILAIMPWNFPYWQVFRAAAATIAAGNGLLLKHAPRVGGCARAIEALFREAGAPEGVFQNLFLSEERTGDLIEHPVVAGVTLTGSVRAGRAVAARAGAALKKVVLELGGSDPLIVLEDADLDQAVEIAAGSRLQNSGQTCIAAKRLLVVDAVREDFEERLLARLRRERVGDPRDETTTVGPLARGDLRDLLHRQVEESVARGAALRLGGSIPAGPGFFYPVTMLAGVRPGMPAFDEETFGPLAAVVPARDEEEAGRLANQTTFGLGATVCTRDPDRAERIARFHLEAGACFANARVRSDARLPFGGIRQSGFGRELGVFGMREFVNVKTVWLD